MIAVLTHSFALPRRDTIPDQQQTRPRRTKRRIIVAAISVIALVWLIAIPAVYWQYHESRKTLNSFSNALVSQHYAKAYTFTSPELRQVTNYGVFLKKNKALVSQFGKLRRIDVASWGVTDSKDGWFATVKTIWVFARTTLPINIELKKEHGKWEIFSYHTP